MKFDLEGLSQADRDALSVVLAPVLEAAGVQVRLAGGDVAALEVPPSDVVLVIGYSTPGGHVARGLYYAVDPFPALMEWSAAAEAARAVVDAAPDRVALIDVDLAAANPKRAIDAFGLRIGCTLDAGLAGRPEPQRAVLMQSAAERWARSREGVGAQLEGLDAAAVTAGLRRKPMDDAGFIEAARAFLAACNAEAAEHDALVEALELCRQDVAALEEASAPPAGSYPVPAVIPSAPTRTKDSIVKRALGRVRRSADLKLIKESGLFDPAWYVDRYPDAVHAGADPALHYLLHGGLEGRPAGPNFNSQLYLQYNPDIAALKINPLVHYLRFGTTEGRKALDLNGQPIGPAS